MAPQPMPHVLVFLPGITGSVLKKDGKVVWGFSAGALGSALLSKGGSMKKALMLEADPPDVDDLGDGVVASGLVPDLHLIPGFWKIDGYTRVIDTIQQRFDVTIGKNLFPFPYDWRRDNRVAARRLARQGREWLARWRESSGNRDARLVLIAHSMGGLVSRYYLEVLEGWKDTLALITFGTPYRGALNSLDSLANGLRQGPGGLLDLTDLARSLTAIYQLLPIYACYDGGDGSLVRVAEAPGGVPNVDPERARAALAFHREIEAAVERNRKQEAYLLDGYRVYPIVGTQQQTSQAGRRKGGGVEMLVSHPQLNYQGDGTVPRPSATPIEYADQGREMFAATKHGSLQNADAVLAHLDGVLSGLTMSTKTLREEEGPLRLPELPPVKVSLEVDDLYMEGQPVTVRAQPQEGRAQLFARLVQHAGAAGPRLPLQPREDGWQAAELGSLPAGAYRVEISGDNVEPAADSFAVARPPASGA